ncbi:trimeric intracellular cation channel family protein [Sansalvadorimonas sp. 2012CJ34-2]|uniref:Trimeric intracellular cation channel family protein n=1 Tax=Parendozoicomonas callyspongiae TaxID=2942213 RepID=A0ABT0PBV9_9GAMM|nr:trimeric intracellular cation channel family protein [Sansalvadorimonas sp. 2012CJ34-2]MCL6268865.1 trimeric intracellular cation channel family protein [Sansalvadorimonas sp. 2012CJ34-2]
MLLNFLDLLGTGVFAATGAMVAARRNLDIFGALVLAFVTAVGGGTIRDFTLGSMPVFWVHDTSYLAIIFLSTALTLFGRRWWDQTRAILLVSDALGLGVFTVIGIEKALRFGVPPMTAVMMGVLTGAGGGLIRDILAGRVPMVLRSEIYATAAIAGGLFYIVMQDVGIARSVVAIACACVVFCLRLLAIYCNMSLPRLTAPKQSRKPVRE